MRKEHIVKMFEALKKRSPTPTTELRYGNTYQLLVAVSLSAQSTDKGVNAATPALFAEVKTPADMLQLGEEKLRRHIQTIGLYRSKARHVMAAARMLESQFGGKVPKKREELQSLPGVGRKTANVILNTAFGLPTIAVDTHVFRVANRTGIAPGKTPEEVEEKLTRRIPLRYRQNAHHWLILHGRHTCKARTPQCSACPLTQWCPRAPSPKLN